MDAVTGLPVAIEPHSDAGARTGRGGAVDEGTSPAGGGPYRRGGKSSPACPFRPHPHLARPGPALTCRPAWR